MKRHEMWRMQYRLNPYLSHLTHKELDQRFKDLFMNFTFLTDDNKIGPVPIDQGGEHWWVLFTHALEEYARRFGGPIPGTLAPIETVNPGKTGAQDACDLVSSMSVEQRKKSCKIGKCKHMIRASKRGEIRINPASFFRDPTLNRAIGDDELRIEARPMPSNRPVPHVIESKTNFYVYCISGRVDARLFQDFGADSCLVIPNKRNFTDILVNAVGKALPGWRLFQGKVQYIDPVLDELIPEWFFFTKHFRYWYQNEYRWVWLPPEPIRDLEPLDLTIEGLGTVVEYHSLGNCLCGG